MFDGVQREQAALGRALRGVGPRGPRRPPKLLKPEPPRDIVQEMVHQVLRKADARNKGLRL